MEIWCVSSLGENGESKNIEEWNKGDGSFYKKKRRRKWLPIAKREMWMSAVPKISGVEKLVIRWSNYKICLWTMISVVFRSFFGLFYIFDIYYLKKYTYKSMCTYPSRQPFSPQGTWNPTSWVHTQCTSPFWQCVWLLELRGSWSATIVVASESPSLWRTMVRLDIWCMEKAPDANGSKSNLVDIGRSSTPTFFPFL